MTDRELPDDAALGDLALLFGDRGAPTVVAEAVAAASGLDVDAAGATVEYVRWRPGRACTVLWSLPRAGGEPVLVSGRLDGSKLALTAFPLDDRLPGLAFAADAQRVGAAVGMELAEARAVSYKPMGRCVLRYDGADGRARLFGKVFRDERAAPMAGWFEALRAAPASDWELPVPAAYLPEPRLLLFHAVEGARELAELLRSPSAADTAAAVAAVRAAAEGLGAFREGALEGPPVVTPQEILRPIERGRRQLDPVLPELARAVGARLQELARLAAELAPEPLGLAHGTFRASQLLVRGERIVVLDLDSLCLAGTARDAGTFLGGLDATATRNPELRQLLAACEAAFVQCIDGVDPRWVAWHRAAACVEHGLRRAYALEPGWPARASRLLERAGEVLPTPAAA